VGRPIGTNLALPLGKMILQGDPIFKMQVERNHRAICEENKTILRIAYRKQKDLSYKSK